MPPPLTLPVTCSAVTGGPADPAGGSDSLLGRRLVFYASTSCESMTRLHRLFFYYRSLGAALPLGHGFRRPLRR